MEIYFSTDVETDGPIPGQNSMLSLASAAFTEDGVLIDTFSVNLRCLPTARGDSGTMEWWKTQPEAWAECRKDPQYIEPAMVAYVEWVESFDGKPVFVAYPAGFDFLFVYWYMMRAVRRSPFSFSALDIKSYAMAKLGIGYRDSTKKNFPREWFSKRKHTHVALDDAIEQGELFFNMLKHWENSMKILLFLLLMPSTMFAQNASDPPVLSFDATVVGSLTDGSVLLSAPSWVEEGTYECGTTVEPPTGDFVYLSDIPVKRSSNVKSGPHMDSSGYGKDGVKTGGYKDIEINGVTYQKGVSWLTKFGTSTVTWEIDGKYKAFDALVRIDDEKTGRYEWGHVVDGKHLALKRPADGYRGKEKDTVFRVGASATIRFLGDGKELYESEEFHAYGDPIAVHFDVTGVRKLTAVLNPDGWEEMDSGYRRGLTERKLVRRCGWFDMVNLANAMLIK